VAGRALAFSDAEIVRLATEEFVAVAADDWYQRRRNDAEGSFFISVANQGPRKGEGGATRQGIYCLTADGQLLAYKNAGQNPGVMREVIQEGLEKWKRLPQSKRSPGAVKVGEPDSEDAQYARTPPKRGLVVNVFSRLLDREGPQSYADAACAIGRGDEAGRDHLWLTEAEWKSLVPSGTKTVERFPVPSQIAERILRFHLVDNTRGEPPMWRREDIRSSELTVTVEETSDAGIKLRLEGKALLTAKTRNEAERGYDARLLGFITYDRQKDAITRFDLVAVGDHWGEGPFTGHARPGRTPLGIAFELATGKSPADAVAPQGAREVGEYFRR
jgi:hypothetical protein